MTEKQFIEQTHTLTETKDWESEIRKAFEQSLSSSNPLEVAIAEEVLSISNLNEFCFIIAPKIAKKIAESNKKELANLEIRVWSSNEAGYVHVAVILKDLDNGDRYLIDAAGLLRNNGEADSPLGITRLDLKANYPLYGNPNIKQYISPPIPRDHTYMGLPEFEEKMGSKEINSLNSL